MNKKKILIIGGYGMLGHSLFYYFTKKGYDVSATTKDDIYEGLFSSDLNGKIIAGVDVLEIGSLKRVFNDKFDLVVNCVGIIKQSEELSNKSATIAINSLFPHQLAVICADNGARLIHISTDCVFSGKRGNYRESDFADADDLYGRSKYLGEIEYQNSLTLRTSIIGHEIRRNLSLVGWLLSQKGCVNGFTNAIYSGLPTEEIAEVIENYVIPNEELTGIYHLSSQPISKYNLLVMIRDLYEKEIEINPCDEPKIDRSLNSEKFRLATGYTPPSWMEMIKKMRKSYFERIALYKK